MKLARVRVFSCKHPLKHYFSVANRQISFGNVCMIQNCFIFFDSKTIKLHAVQL